MNALRAEALGPVAVCTCVKDDEETSMALENIFLLPQRVMEVLLCTATS